MAETNQLRQGRVRGSDTYDDTIPSGQADLETNSTNLEYDNNAKRSQIARILDSAGVTRWFSDIPIFNGKKRGIKQLNEDLNTLEIVREQIDSFIPTAGQTIFTLTQIPNDPNQPTVNLNGQTLNVGAQFNVSGTTLQILLSYDLGPEDNLYVKYNYNI